MDKTDILQISDLDEQVEALLQEMTLEEKASLLAGSSHWYSTAVDRLGIPSIKVTDGPAGARGGGGFSGGANSAACLPAGIALAATWNSELVEKVGQVLGEESRSKGCQLLLAPTVNIHRSPLNGRNFECYSEDPFLSARTAVAYINGVQSENVGATVKHFVCNDSEFERNSIDVKVDQRALREIYLPPFKAAVQEAKSWAVMASYNKVNGTFATENSVLLIDLLKKEWGFDGIVMSDWYGTKSTAASVIGGQELEMPGPPRCRGDKLLQALQTGEIEESAIDTLARRMLRLIVQSGKYENPDEPPEQAIDKPAHRAIARQAAIESIVLLKNDHDLLPLDTGQIGKIAIIGPNAKTAQIMGGGSANINPHYAISPYNGIVEKLSQGEGASSAVEIAYAIGCINHKWIPALSMDHVKDGSLIQTFFGSTDLSGKPIYEALTANAEQLRLDETPPGEFFGPFSMRLHGRYTPLESGSHAFSLISAGLSRLFIDGKEIIDNWTQQTRGTFFFGNGSIEVVGRVSLNAGQSYEINLEYSRDATSHAAAVRLGHMPPISQNAIDEAAAAAASADVALIFVGLNGDWEMESHDRPDLELPGQQAALIERVADANPNTAVILQSGSPVSMPWVNNVPAILQAWYPGQECGRAIADVLFGDTNPSGKLPQTFPMRLEDNPTYINYPGENGVVRYGEGIFVGYRYYEKKKIQPLFPFGHGLSYSRFLIGNLRLSSAVIGPEDELVAAVDVRNEGTRAGQEVVQLYISDSHARLSRPVKELKGFAKVMLQPEEMQTVEMRIDKRDLAYWDDREEVWTAEAGEFKVMVGSSSQHIAAQISFVLSKTAKFGGPHS